MDLSPAERLALLNQTERSRLLRKLSNNDVTGLLYDWDFWARPSQLPPADDDWVYYMMLAGRGSGKTRAGAEFVRKLKNTMSPIALIGPTHDDVMGVMVQGPAGIQSISPPGDYPVLKQNRLIWPNGAVAQLFSAERPDRLRGPQHAAGWADELAAWKYPAETWSNFEFGLRVGRKPQAMITTTPRPIRIVRQLIADPLCRVHRTSSYANRAHLPPRYFERIIARHEGTRLGRQEIYGEILDDVPGALWTRDGIESERLPFGHRLPPFKRIVVAIDPAMSSGEDADETGIIVAACDWSGHGYVLADVSGHYQPVEWARLAIAQYKHPERKADRIVAEINAGGEMVEHTIRMVDDAAAITTVHASRGKAIRAEPVSALYEQHRVHHVGFFPQLEDQMTNFTVDYDRARDGSPDRVDALVWAFTDLLVEPEPPPVIVTDEMVRTVSQPTFGRRRW